jgi:hypothetical protein
MSEEKEYTVYWTSRRRCEAFADTPAESLKIFEDFGFWHEQELERVSWEIFDEYGKRVLHGGNPPVSTIIIPAHDFKHEDGPNPGGIEPGRYTVNQFVGLLREHRHNPKAIQFLADMLET